MNLKIFLVVKVITIGLRDSKVSYINFVQAGETIPQKIQDVIDRYENH